ncbi:hypothetical protein J7355_13765 [Endozoicomonas sp. G2_2]|uniref:hypothetical protein n=1 Tax=Gammaproteobacteria TaxID=1236 RepID=UPI001ADC4D84|nr:MULTISPECIES: hypothetical protein [Gammaproteobacteria]MBO9471161.1 hypothetical protein [Endozoicomonas sp. G2_2]
MNKLSHKTPTPLIRSGLAAALMLAPFAAAQAYVGPGAGLSLLGALWGVVAAIGAALLFVVLWPIRRMRRRKKEEAANAAAADKTAHHGDSSHEHSSNS